MGWQAVTAAGAGRCCITVAGFSSVLPVRSCTTAVTCATGDSAISGQQPLQQTGAGFHTSIALTRPTPQRAGDTPRLWQHVFAHVWL